MKYTLASCRYTVHFPYLLAIFVAVENFIVSARKYRPATFESVVGQKHITSTLKNAIKNNQLAQAFLFCGPRGVGKTTCARILAKTINCQNLQPEAEACGVCDSCRAFQNGNSFSIHELDAASNNSVDDIRSLIEQVRIPPQTGRYKIYIIDEVHMLSQQAFNAFLKTLEEPPAYAIFILATTEKHKILPTILSRCQIFDFNRIKIEDIANHLADIAQKEDIKYDADGLHLIAQKADGGLRDALSMFDQIVSFSERNVSYKAVIDNLNILDYDYYFDLTEAILATDMARVLLIFDQVLSQGFDGNHFITGLASHLRNLLVAKDAQTVQLLEVSQGIRNKYAEQSKVASPSFLVSGLSITNQCDLNYKQSKNQRLQVELALIKLCHLPSALNLSQQPQQTVEVKKKPDAEKLIPVSPVSEAINPEPEIVTEIKKNDIPPPQSALSNEVIPTEEIPAIKSKIAVKPLMPASNLIIPNLNELTSKPKQVTSEPSYIPGDSKSEFTIEELLTVWNHYANDAKKAGKQHIFTLMTANAPQLSNDYQIEVTIENKIQATLLDSEKIDLLNHLRSTLKNFNIGMVTKITEQTAKKALYTSTEKYQHMVDKNPKLEEFRKRFNLDLDY